MLSQFTYIKRWLLVCGVVLLCTLPIVARAQTNPNAAKITTPKEGDSLFGLITIQGIASSPNLQRYLLEFDRQDTQPDQWFTLAGPITQQVNGGILAQWNTTTVPDGRYQIRLRVVLRDGTVYEDIVQNLHVSNKQPTPIPTIQPTATIATPVRPTVGPSPTPLVQQPPTATIRPTTVQIAAPVAPTQPPADSGDAAPIIVPAFDALQQAFCFGAYIAFAGFGLFFAYRLGYSRLRPLLRRMFGRG